MVGRKYTWYKVNGFEKCRLDKVLVTKEWVDKWEGYKQ